MLGLPGGWILKLLFSGCQRKVQGLAVSYHHPLWIIGNQEPPGWKIGDFRTNFQFNLDKDEKIFGKNPDPPIIMATSGKWMYLQFHKVSFDSPWVIFHFPVYRHVCTCSSSTNLKQNKVQRVPSVADGLIHLAAYSCLYEGYVAPQRFVRPLSPPSESNFFWQSCRMC